MEESIIQEAESPPRNTVIVDHLWKESLLHPTYINKLYWGKENGDVNIKKCNEINLTFSILHAYCISSFTYFIVCKLN